MDFFFYLYTKSPLPMLVLLLFAVVKKISFLGKNLLFHKKNNFFLVLSVKVANLARIAKYSTYIM